MLAGMRVAEGSVLVAAPLGRMTLAQFHAHVIHFDLGNAREEIAAILEQWFAEIAHEDGARRFDAHRVLWGPYQTMQELHDHDPRASAANPMLVENGRLFDREAVAGV